MSWRPRGIVSWLLTLVAAVLAASAAVLAWCMAFPVRWDGIGKLGAVALFYPLHLLLGAMTAVVLAIAARSLGARLAAGVFRFAAILITGMALIPAGATWLRARELGVPLSLRAYLDNAGRMNTGLPQPARTVSYGTASDGVKLLLDVWSTGAGASGSPRPAVVMVHGGAWNHGNRSMLPEWNLWLNSLGYEVFDVEYRMPPPVRWLEEVGDVKSALGWVAANAAELHVDPTRISVMGGSAGANLSMLAAYSMGDPRLPPSSDASPVAVHRVIDVYGPADMSLLYRACKSPGYVRPLMERYIGGAPEAFPDRYRLLSPLSWVAASSPPTLILLGTSDRLVAREQAELLGGALAKAGVPHETVLLPGNDHGFDVNWGGFGTQIARARIQAFLAR